MSNSDIFISGFTFIKNGLTLGYPIVESIRSIEPICDEIVINVCFTNQELTEDDGTYNLLVNQFNHPKFKIIKSFWDPNKTTDGLILAEQTNRALNECKGKFCCYIQGDEIVHEDELSLIQNSVMEMNRNEYCDGLVFNYIHFYGNTNIIKHTRKTYRREVRIIRNNKGIISHLDAQGFRHQNGDKLKSLLTSAHIYHYGWARNTSIMDFKIKEMDRLYHGQHFNRYNKPFEYEHIWGLKPFRDSHPKVVENWVKEHYNDINLLDMPLKFEWKNINFALADFIESITGYRIGEYKGYELIGKIK